MVRVERMKKTMLGKIEGTRTLKPKSSGEPILQFDENEEKEEMLYKSTDMNGEN